MQLFARPKSVFSWDFDVSVDGRHLVTIDMGWFRERGRFVLNRIDYEVFRDGWPFGEFVLQSEGKTLARARAGLTRRFTVQTGGREYHLQASGMFTRSFELLEAGHPIGHMIPQHPFTRCSTIELPSDLTPPVQIFMIWLVLVTWKRQNHSATAAG